MIVHMGWVGSEPPAHVLAAVEAVRQSSPGCDVMLHTDESMVPEKWLAVSRQLRPQMRSDVQRHCILRRLGGLWLDSDVRVLRNPAEWTAGWDRYTAIRVARGRGVVGTDIIYVPPGWSGWDIVEPYLDRMIEQIATTRRVRVFALAGSMIEACERQRPEAFSILEHGTMFPYDPDLFCTASVVARGFDPPANPAVMPSFLTRARNFAAAAATHVAAGMRLASDEERERRFAICQQCEFFDGSACRKCGCGVSRERAYVSKLSWATSSCPVGKWAAESA